MSKILETKDAQVLKDVKAIQDEAGGATRGGVPRIGCKLIKGRFVPLDELPGYTPDQWRGTREIHAVEVDKDGTRRLELTDDTVERIEKAKAKKASDRDDNERKLARATLKDKPGKPTEEPRIGAGEAGWTR